jgi:hypothetical protein
VRPLRELDYWTRHDGTPKALVRVAARCVRCPVPIVSVPRDKVHLARARRHDGYVRLFVCPHCRRETRTTVGVREALRLYAAGATALRSTEEPQGPTADDLLDLLEQAASEDIVRRALDDGLARL